MRASAQVVSENRLRLSRAPVAELAASALDAQREAGLPAGATFIVVAVEPGKGTDEVRRAIEAAATAAA